MIKISVTYKDAKDVYSKFIKDSKGFLGLGWFEHKEELNNFSEIQKENGAFNNVYLGIKEVEIEQIKGSVQKYQDFDRNFIPKNSVVEDRWCRIYMANMNGIGLPLVNLYKIKDDYFVYDGNHRISVAKYLNFKSIEAEVTEFIPSKETKENAIYRERFIFEKTTGIDGIIFTETEQYSRISKEIFDYKEFVEKKEGNVIGFPEISILWYENIYLPAIRIFEENDLLNSFKGRTLSDLFVYFLNHKYYESEKKGMDIGFSYALIDFVNWAKADKENSSENMISLNDSVKENLKNLFYLDKKKYLDPEIIMKNRILKEITGIEFNHNFFLLFEIDEFINSNGIGDFEAGVKEWYEKSFMKKIESLKKIIEKLPEFYTKKSEAIFSDTEKLFFSIQNYAFSYERNIAWIPTFNEIISNYVIEIYIPLIHVLTKAEFSETKFRDEYFEIHSRLNYLKEYKPDVTIDEAAEYHFKQDGKKYQKLHDWFLLKFNDSSKNEILIDYNIGKFEMKLANRELFKDVLEKYGKPKKYGTIFKLEKAMDDYYRNAFETDWVKDKLAVDLEKINENKIVMTYYKTKSVMENIKGTEAESSLIDFYSDIVSYESYMGKNLNDLDIIDLIMDYKERQGV